MMKILRKILSKNRRREKKSDGLYKLVMDSESKEKKKIIKEAVRMANEEQRKIYYSPEVTKITR
jgi:hypothetical protein